jgi:hypothetical protein
VSINLQREAEAYRATADVAPVFGVSPAAVLGSMPKP